MMFFLTKIENLSKRDARKVFRECNFGTKSDLEAHISLYFRYQIRERPQILKINNSAGRSKMKKTTKIFK